MAQAALLAATAVYGAYSADQAGEAQEKLSRRNASMIEASAADSLARGEEEVLATKRRIRRTIGSQRAGFAAQGVDVGTGSALDIQNESRELGEVDIAQVRKNAFREAWNLNTQAANTRLAGTYARRASRNQVAGTLLGGVGQASSYWDGSAPSVAGST